MNIFHKVLLSGVCASCLIFESQVSNAAGFYIQEQSVSGLGTAFAGSVTSLKDPSAMYFNPAGLTQVEGIQGQLASHLLIPSADLTDRGSTRIGGAAINGGDGGNPYDPTPVPNGFISANVADNLWIGLGVTAPFGLANEYDRDWFGRFDSIKTELKVIDVQPTIAYKVNDSLSIGAGLNFQHADAELTNAASANVTEGVSTLKGDDVTVGYNLGLQYRPWEQTTIGLSYRSAINHELEGVAKTEGTTIADFDVSGAADLHLPDIATFGISQGLNEKWTIMGQATWFGWSNFKDITTVTNEAFAIAGVGANYAAGDVLSTVQQGYENTWAFAVGTEYMHSNNWTFRAGVQFDETPTTDQFRTTRTPDGDRTWLSGGGTYKFNDALSLDFAGTYIWIEDESINVTRNNAINQAVATQVVADTEGNVGIVSLGLTYKF